MNRAIGFAEPGPPPWYYCPLMEALIGPVPPEDRRCLVHEIARLVRPGVNLARVAGRYGRRITPLRHLSPGPGAGADGVLGDPEISVPAEEQNGPDLSQE
jgi:hypothetical protein